MPPPPRSQFLFPHLFHSLTPIKKYPASLPKVIIPLPTASSPLLLTLYLSLLLSSGLQSYFFSPSLLPHLSFCPLSISLSSSPLRFASVFYLPLNVQCGSNLCLRKNVVGNCDAYLFSVAAVFPLSVNPKKTNHFDKKNDWSTLICKVYLSIQLSLIVIVLLIVRLLI